MWLTPMSEDNDKPYLTHNDPGDENDYIPGQKHDSPFSEVGPSGEDFSEGNWEDEGGAHLPLFD